jgi:membrane protein
MDPAADVQRILALPPVRYAMTVFEVYGRAAGGLLANGLAYAALFSSFPIILLVLGVAGFVVGDPAAQLDLADALKTLFPPLSDFVDSALTTLSATAPATSLIGLVGVIWAVSQFYVTLDVAFSRIFSEEMERNVVRRTVRGFIWVALLIGVVVLSVVLGVVATTLTALFPQAPAAVSTIRSVLGSWPFLLAVGIVVTAVVYRALPPVTPSFASIWLPAVIVGIVVVALSQLFLTIAPLLVGAAALAGSVATAFVALAWLSFTFQALLYGASWVRVREDRRRGVPSTPGGSALASAAASAEPGGGGE